MQPENKKAYQAVEQEVRHLDPVETVAEGYDDTALAAELVQDITQLDTVLATDDTLTDRERLELYDMGTNLRLDWLYAKHGGRKLPLSAFAAEVKDTENFITQAAREAYDLHEHHPQGFWAMQTKLLDLRAYTAYRFAADSQTTLGGTEQGQKLFGFSEDLMKSVLIDSIRLMRDMEQYSDGPSRGAKDARGALYELMLTTYARYTTYRDQTFDTIFVRSALSREDRPWNNHVYPKRAFDIVIQSPEATELLQAKNYHNEDEYAQPIVKIVDESFSDTLNDLPKYITDLSLILDNPKDPLLKAPLAKAQRRLDKVFGSQLAAIAATSV